MTIFDLAFLLLALAAVVTVIGAGVAAICGKRREAVKVLQNLGLYAAAYIGIVYVVTALSRQTVHHVAEAECSDDWCIAVQDVKQTPKNTKIDYELTLRIFSRAQRRAQRENIATDVYLVDADWNRYDPILDGSEIPLNTLLQPMESVTTHRRFELPADAKEIGLKVGRRDILPVCLIIGECEAFHKGQIIRIN
ncbi:MAG TPA: hypothetical protein VKY31_11755 [Terriglobia bacterium]|nr:hypothetical protein [Terriglobia bacterium]